MFRTFNQKKKIKKIVFKYEKHREYPLFYIIPVRKDLDLRLQFRFFNNLHRKGTMIQ